MGTVTNISENITDVDIPEPVHIAGSHALCVFISFVTALWSFLLSWVTYSAYWCFFRHRSRRDTISPYKVFSDVYRNEIKLAKTLRCTWSSINFAILWSNLSSLIYCHSGSENCILYYKTDSEMTNVEYLFIMCVITTYLIQLVETIRHLREQTELSSAVLITALIQQELKSKPVVEWTASCCTMKESRMKI